MTNWLQGKAQKKEADKGGKPRGITSTMLKWIAVITMLIDHIGAVVVLRFLFSRGLYDVLRMNDVVALQAWRAAEGNDSLLRFYDILRLIGRNAFPIYCFLLVEGLFRTRNRLKYLGRLAVFAVISEVPFDLAICSTVWAPAYQNVFFTLAISLLTMMLVEKIYRLERHKKLPRWLGLLLILGICAAGMGGAKLLRTDYGWKGVACILVLYFFRRYRAEQLLAGCAAFLIFLEELTAIPAFILLLFYRGEKGAGLKYFFYGIYPAHLLILYLICVWMGIAGYPAVL